MLATVADVVVDSVLLCPDPNARRHWPDVSGSRRERPRASPREPGPEERRSDDDADAVVAGLVHDVNCGLIEPHREPRVGPPRFIGDEEVPDPANIIVAQISVGPQRSK